MRLSPAFIKPLWGLVKVVTPHYLSPFEAPPSRALPTRPVRIHGTQPRVAPADWRNLAIILVGFLALLAILPPAHEYPVIDDWIYHDTVQAQLATGRFYMHDQSQTSLVGQALWGTLWSRLFGFTYTTLTASTLALALAGLLAFYGLARRVGVAPNGALLAVALLALNPIWLHLSYSFMTDVPFLALSLVASYAYMRGLDGSRLAWLWLVAGGLLSGWAFLIRQFGILVPAGFLLYLLVDALATRRVRWIAILLVGAVPAAIVGWWLLWSAGQPITSAMRSAEGWRDAFVGKPVWLPLIVMRALALLPLAALSVPLALRWPRRHLMPLLALAGGLFALALAWPNSVQQLPIGQTEQPFAFTLGPLGFELPRQPFTFGIDGSIVRVEGINFYGYHQQPIWTPEAWRLLFVVGTAMGALLVVAMCASLYSSARSRVRRSTVPPVIGFYLGSLLVCLVTLGLSGQIYDRYLLGFLPALLLFSVRDAAKWGRGIWNYAVATLLVVGLFSILLKVDAMDHTNTRWQAGNWFTERGVTAWSGLDWNRGVWLTDWNWQVSDVPLAGYRTEAAFPYTCRLCGWQPRTVLAQVKEGLPPLQPPPR